MKFSKLSQLFLVSSIGLLVATLLTACQIVTIDYVMVASSASSGTGNTGTIDTYAVDSESGALRAGASPVSSGGTTPVAMAVSPDFANLYVANQGNLVHFAIASNGVLTQKDTVTLASPPASIAVNTAKTYLYVVTGGSSATLTAYSIAGGTIGSVVSQQPIKLYGTYGSFNSDTMVPTGVTVLTNNSAVYVTAYDQSAYNPGGATTSTANPGWVFGYTVGTGGALVAAANPYEAGVKPTALVADPTNRFLYVTDYASNELIGYTIQSSSTLNFLINGPFRTGNEPSAIVIDPRGKYIYISNALDSSVSAYVIDLSTGTPSAAANATGPQTNVTDTQPVAIVVDPALGRFVFTANYLGNSVSGFRLDPNAGTLAETQATPYPTGPKPTALVTVPHGNHSTQWVPQ